MRKIIIAAIAAFLAVSANGQTAREFKQASDSLTVLLKQRTTVRSRLTLSKVLRRSGVLDLYFSNNLEDYHWNASDVKWFREEIERQFPSGWKSYALGDVYAKNINLDDLVTPDLGNKGKASAYALASASDDKAPFVRRVGAKRYPKGLTDRTIALWQSHGLYYDDGAGCWQWQRAALFGTVEDMYTQSYVLPFLIPMLENAGAYVMTPRERDIQTSEVICDNDPQFAGERGEGVRQPGKYEETGAWKVALTGFADAQERYLLDENPFTMGTVRMADCVSGKATATATWTPCISKSGEYAVYVSYATLGNSTRSAHYTVRHAGGTTEFLVDQNRGGGTWIYLGTFPFEAGDGNACVMLDNVSKESGRAVSADAVRFGGGMGKVARGREGGETLSGMPAYAEGALYSMVWGGMSDPDKTRLWETDYSNDYAGRGAWTNVLKRERNVPFDLSVAFHSDAGVTPDDSIVGTLSIYTRLCEGSSRLPDGNRRMVCRHLADLVQTQICNDIREDFNPDWSRRMLWDRSYSESRTSGVPAVLIELLSHQNFADMKYGLDPTFRFDVSRAVYKGVLKFLSDYHRIPYVVQPLPVHDMSLKFTSGGKALLTWSPTEDEKEPTAVTKGYFVYTRVDGGAFDAGVEVKDARLEFPIEAGHIYSCKVVAFNDGGCSFPSETLSIGCPGDMGNNGPVMVVNAFTRVSGPAWFETQERAGFDFGEDAGVPYMREINHIGDCYEFCRDKEYAGNTDAGFGACYLDDAGQVTAGNTFDFPYIHGRAIMESGRAFCSSGVDAFVQDEERFGTIDLICGKQVTTMVGCGKVPARHEVFPLPLQKAVSAHVEAGGNVVVSGAYIATDAWGSIYPFGNGHAQGKAGAAVDPDRKEATRQFIMDVLGYKYASSHPTRSGIVAGMRIVNYPSEYKYRVEHPDGIAPASSSGRIALRYDKSNVGASVRYRGDGYRVVSFGFPLESLESDSDISAVMGSALDWLDAK